MNQPSIHASAIAFGKHGVLIRGPSGSGKSDLVLRLIDSEGFGIGHKPLRAKLVADDQVILKLKMGSLFASAPETLKGKLEIRGHGIVSVKCAKQAKLLCVVDLVQMSEIERMPSFGERLTLIQGIALPCVKLCSASPAAPARLRSFLQETLAKSFTLQSKTR